METVIKQVELMKISLEPNEVLVVTLKTEYNVDHNEFKTFHDKLSKTLGVPKDRVLLVCGNIDLSFTAIKPAPEGTDDV